MWSWSHSPLASQNEQTQNIRDTGGFLFWVMHSCSKCCYNFIHNEALDKTSNEGHYSVDIEKKGFCVVLLCEIKISISTVQMFNNGRKAWPILELSHHHYDYQWCYENQFPMVFRQDVHVGCGFDPITVVNRCLNFARWLKRFFFVEMKLCII